MHGSVATHHRRTHLSWKSMGPPSHTHPPPTPHPPHTATILQHKSIRSLVLEVDAPHADDVALVGGVVERAVQRAVVADGRHHEDAAGGDVQHLLHKGLVQPVGAACEGREKRGNNEGMTLKDATGGDAQHLLHRVLVQPVGAACRARRVKRRLLLIGRSRGGGWGLNARHATDRRQTRSQVSNCPPPLTNAEVDHVHLRGHGVVECVQEPGGVGDLRRHEKQQWSPGAFLSNRASLSHSVL